ncbi:MAG: DUF6537 domain-containing protein [Burkholderiaceae bacterium]
MLEAVHHAIDAAQALAIAAIPEQIRGFGHVKTASVEKAHARLAQLQQPLTTRDLFPAPHAAEPWECKPSYFRRNSGWKPLTQDLSDMSGRNFPNPISC